MTAVEFALLVQAQRTGPSRWKARCPAHNDRCPSLSIREGGQGAILLHCFAGCSLDAILAALELARRDLFAGPPPTAKQLAARRAAQEQQEQAAKEQRKARLAAITKAEKFQAIVNALGARLARAPENERLTRLFDQAVWMHHEAETELEQFYPMRRECAQEQEIFHEPAA